MSVRVAKKRWLFVLLLWLAGCGGVSRSSQSGQALATSVVLTPFITGLNAPVDLQQPDDGTGRFFVVELAGTIRVFQNGALSSAPFLDIRSKVIVNGEMGLLGAAFHPDFAHTGLFYVHYDRTTPSGSYQSVIAEYSVSAANPNVADAASERIILTVDQPPFTNHKGGQIVFGSDGFLYIALGDGGSEGDPLGNGQNTNTLLAKILRLDVNATSAGKEYGIPPDNPFVAGGGLPEIWAYGLRNPFRFSFDRSTGRLFAGDVGQDRYEEIDLIQRGANYGWNIMEGFHCYNPPSGCNETGLTLPIAEYDHSEGNAVIGGYVYRGTKIPNLQGAYIFGDDGSGKIWALQEISPGTWNRTLLMSSGHTISSFGRDQYGEIYVVDLNGTVFSIAAQ